MKPSSLKISSAVGVSSEFSVGAELRTETGELLGGDADVLQDLAESGAGGGGILHKWLEDVVEQAAAGVGGAVNLDGADGSGG